MTDTRTSYDRVAAEYTQQIAGELAHKPFDRAQLERLGRAAHKLGPICDLGCGPGHVAAYLHQHAAVCGLDLSPRMVATARQLQPALGFAAGDMLALPLASASLGGIAAFYSIIHLPRTQLSQAFCEMHRVLKPTGVALLAFHIGEETVHLSRWWNKQVALDFHFFLPRTVAEALEHVGFVVDNLIEREPYAPVVEHQSRRAYIFAHKPA